MKPGTIVLPRTSRTTASEGTAIDPRAPTGFYLRKAINPTVAAGEVQFSGTDWIELRYAEVLLRHGPCSWNARVDAVRGPHLRAVAGRIEHLLSFAV